MDEVGTNGYSYMYQWFSGSGNRAAVISDKFMSIFDEKDMKGDLRKDYTVKNYQNGNELRKYMAGDISNSLNKTCEVAYPIYRYTDRNAFTFVILVRFISPSAFFRSGRMTCSKM